MINTLEKQNWSKQRAWSRKVQSETADCGPIDLSRRNWHRWERCRDDLHTFLQAYFPASTGLRLFSDDHLRVISRIESCILRGGRYANVVFRGFGKTSVAEGSALWATMYGHRRFVPIFSATDQTAKQLVLSMKRELSDNDMLSDDFPHICQPILALEGKAQRCASQTCDGLPTFIQWNADRIVFPSVHGSNASGAVISAYGLTAAILGMKHKRPDGTQQRPDFVLIDDPSTAESAASPLQNAKRLDIVTRSILKMAGHRTQIACIINGTVREPDDMMDTLLDQRKSSAWQSERIPMIRRWSDAHETLWMTQYADIRRGFDPQKVGDQQRAHRSANEFYLAHREEMDAGCVVSWRWCYVEDSGDPNVVPEISAIQHAYNLLIDDGEAAFASEMQCQPLRIGAGDSPAATKEQILARMVTTPRGVLPNWTERLTAYIDVQGKLLYWIVMAWRSDFTGHIVDYGTFPDQKRAYFALSDAKNTLASHFPGAGEEGRLTSGIDKLAASLVGHAWRKADRSAMRVDRLLVDMGYKTDIVKECCELSPYSAIVTPSKGQFYGAKTRIHMSDYKKRDCEIVSRDGWIITKGIAGGKTRYVLIDTNRWKSFLHARLKMANGERGCVTLCADANRHMMLIDHLAAEECHIRSDDKTMRTCEEWDETSLKDNHWLDCAVGATVAASILGCRLGGGGKSAFERPNKVSFSQRQALAKAGKP